MLTRTARYYRRTGKHQYEVFVVWYTGTATAYQYALKREICTETRPMLRTTKRDEACVEGRGGGAFSNHRDHL